MSNNPAVQSLNQFGGMINRNIFQPAAYALDHVNPVTLNRNITSAIQNAPDAMKKYDKAYGDMVRTDLYDSASNQAPTTVLQPSIQAQYDNPMSPVKKPLAKVTPPAMESIAQPKVNIRKYDYSTGKPFSSSDLQQHKRDQQYAKDYGLSPYDNQHVTPSNWHSTSKKYNSLNRDELVRDDTGAYLFDNTYMQKRYGNEVYRPRTESERIAEGKAAFPQIYGYQGLSAEQQQQAFQNELAVRKHGLDIQKRNDALQKQTPVNLQPQFTTEYDENYNETGKTFAGSFNPRTGIYTQASHTAVPPILDQPTFEALSQAKQMSKKSNDAMDAYYQLLMELGLTLDWDADYAE